MTREEFGQITVYIGTAVGKYLEKGALEVYWDLLGDLPAESLQLAAKRVLLEHKYPSFPSACELRSAAAETERGEVSGLSGHEAWALAWRAVARIDLDIDGSKERALQAVPAPVAEALSGLGLANVIHGREPVGVVRAQFIKAYEAVAARNKRAALLPAATRAAIEQRLKVAPLLQGIADATRCDK